MEWPLGGSAKEREDGLTKTTFGKYKNKQGTRELENDVQN
ncbi:hypothetical protein QG37_02119 [Candidozyma auris]|uniref:Uncharacterized protein n=1 Tax=Candidozyma auris TaxID=498019 RepID=A0A0L0P4K2_CANAR|nr:hypothetical protein QG37_02119 [[Candida] auris]